MNQFFMSNHVIRTTINVLFPPAIRNGFAQVFRSFLDDICMIQQYIYFALDAVPFLRWMCPMFELMDMFICGFCRLIAYAIKIEVWYLWIFAKLYFKLLRYAVYLFFGYSILMVLANMEISANISLLEMILQNTEWIYQYAVQFIDFNVAIVEKAVENFCSVPFEQRSYFEQEFLGCVKQFVDSANQFINS